MFAWTVRRFARMIFSARPQDRTDRVGARIDSVLRFFFGQKKVVEKTTIPAKRWPRFVSAMGSKYHFFIFWGFLVITIGSVEVLIQGVVPTFSLRAILGETLGAALYACIDFFCGLVLIVIAFAFFRRIVLQPRLIPMTRDAAAILGAIALLMISYFGMRFADGTLAETSWWVHVVILLAFLNYLPYSKHIHLLGALPNIFFRNLGQRGVLPKLNLEDDDMGASCRVEQFTWKSLLDSYACTECARCTNYCPAYNTGKPLSPMQLIHDLRDDLRLPHARSRSARRARSIASSTASRRPSSAPRSTSR